MKNIKYPAIIEYDKTDNGYNVRFPDLPGCFTCADSLEDAKKMAKEALTGYLTVIDLKKMKIPEPSEIEGDNIYLIEPEKNVAFAIWLRKHREYLGLSQIDVAKRLGVKYQTYQRFEDPNKANPTLNTIVRLEKVFNEQLVVL